MYFFQFLSTKPTKKTDRISTVLEKSPGIIRSIRHGVQERQVHYYGHVMCMGEDSCVKKCCTLMVEEKCGKT